MELCDLKRDHSTGMSKVRLPSFQREWPRKAGPSCLPIVRAEKSDHWLSVEFCGEGIMSRCRPYAPHCGCTRKSAVARALKPSTRLSFFDAGFCKCELQHTRISCPGGGAPQRLRASHQLRPTHQGARLIPLRREPKPRFLSSTLTAPAFSSRKKGPVAGNVC